eukprot:g14155.t1
MGATRLTPASAAAVVCAVILLAAAVASGKYCCSLAFAQPAQSMTPTWKPFAMGRCVIWGALDKPCCSFSELLSS